MTDASRRGGTGRLVLISLLAVSLLFNALALGAGVRIYRATQGVLGAGAGLTLPRDLRQDLRAALVADKDSVAPALQAMQQARVDAILALTAQPYDPAKAALALDNLRASITALMTELQPTVLQAMAERSVK